MKLFTFAASLRTGSWNQKLMDHTSALLREQGATVTEVAFADLAQMPIYSGDLQDSEGFPEAAERWKSLLEEHDGFVATIPEYNYSIPGGLKNAIDWVSRYRPQPFRGSRAFLLSASPSMVGGNRGLWASRVPFELLGVHVYPDMFSLARANKAFDEDGSLEDKGLEQRLNGALEGFLGEFK